MTEREVAAAVAVLHSAIERLTQPERAVSINNVQHVCYEEELMNRTLKELRDIKVGLFSLIPDDEVVVKRSS